MKRIQWQYASLFLCIIILDRITKWCAMHFLDQQVHITSFFSCILVINRGFSWSIFHSSNNVVFYCVSAVVIFVTACLMYYAYHLYQQKISIMCEIMIISG